LEAEFRSKTVGDGKLDVQVQDRSSSSDIRDELISKISEQASKVRQLKSAKAAKAVIDSEVKVLLALKSEFKSVAGEEWQPVLQSPIVSIAPEELPGDQLSSKIIEQGDIVRKLKAEKAAKEIVDTEVKTLLALKAEYKSVTGVEWKPVLNKPVPMATMTDQDGKSEEAEADVLTVKITQQGNIVRKLKSSGGDKVSSLLVLFTPL
jgi:bifunctional glutamyl/prolyl-tRNA synthetase